MPTEIQVGLSIAWRDAAPVQAGLSAAWRDATGAQSIGSGYTPPTVPGGTGVPPGGSLAPRREVLPAVYYPVPHTLVVTDLRDDSILAVDRVSIQYQDGSTYHTCTLQGPAELAVALRAGEQPAQFRVTLNDDVWDMLVEEVDQPRAFARGDVTVRARSLAALADSPTQQEQQWQVDAPTTAAQLSSLAQTFTDLTAAWTLSDWPMPADSWSFTGTPVALVRALAQAVGADVIADRTGYGVTVRARYDIAPNLWATTAPEWQVPIAAVESIQQTRADTPEYDGLVVAGTRTGDVLTARLAGTSGSRQAPMVTDSALTDIDALKLRADAQLLGYGKQLRETRVLQIHNGRAIREGELVRWIDDDKTWTGKVRSYSIEATLSNAVQSVTCERRTAWIPGSVLVPTPAELLLLWMFNEPVGSNTFKDLSAYNRSTTQFQPLSPALYSNSWSNSGTTSLRCLSFDSGIRLSAGAGENLRFSESDDFTIEAFIKLPPVSSGRTFRFQTADRDIRFTYLGGISTVPFTGPLFPSPGPVLNAPAGSLVDSGHVAICRKFGRTKLFTGGVEVWSGQDLSVWDLTTLVVGPEEIGSLGQPSAERFIDSVRVVRGALYTSTFVPPARLDGSLEVLAPSAPTPPPALYLAAPYPASGPATAASGGGTLALNNGVAPVAYTLSASPSATISPRSGTLNPGQLVAFTVTPPAAGTYVISVSSSSTVALPPAVVYTANSPPPTVVITMTTTTGPAGASVTGGRITLVNGEAGVVFTLTSSLSATFTPANGSLPTSSPFVDFAFLPLVAGNHSISAMIGGGLSNPAPVSFVATAAAGVLMNFTGTSNFVRLLQFYAGGTDGSGNSGANLGVVYRGAFGFDCTQLDSVVLNPPSADMVMFFAESPAFLNRSSGFNGNLRLFFSTKTTAHTITVHSAINGGGTLLMTINLPALGEDALGRWVNWQEINVTLPSTARSINFEDTINQVIFDNIRITPL